MKYFIRTTLERQLDNSYSQIEYELLIDKEHNARKSFIEQLEYLATLNEDLVVLEDDLILCKDFKNRIEKIILEHNTEVINFFYHPSKYFKSRYTYFFIWNQCVYYPKEILKKLSVKMRELYTKNLNMPHDELEGQALSLLGLKTYLPRPCLVQHLDTSTLIQNKCLGNRRTPYFIDYLDELNIVYDEAYKYKKELTELMQSKFNNNKRR